ncbi:siderophore-interacting protein [Ornithinimicrobium sp. Arc0846-15]|nr:siderophore-interacting protein [Ornithinimicrobium laminariae]
MHGIVQSVHHVSPHLIRVVLGGPGLADFKADKDADSYVNLAFPGTDAPYEMPCDLKATRDLPRAQQPVRRRYTVRAWDAETRHMSIDFVVHGDEGVAGPWAARAKPGDVLQFQGPGGGYSPKPTADWHLLVGDGSAIPAISVALERLAPDATAYVFLEAETTDDEIDLASPANVQITWVSTSVDGAALVDAVRKADLPSGQLHGFIHGEAAMVRGMRWHLIKERGVDAFALSATPYWRTGHTDEAWRSVKKEWLGQQKAAEKA